MSKYTLTGAFLTWGFFYPYMFLCLFIFGFLFHDLAAHKMSCELTYILCPIPPH